MLAGQLPACEFVKQACARQVADLKRKKWKYRFSTEAADRVCRFIEFLPHVKGRQWAGQTLKLEPWQVFILTTVFGWLDESDHRRFRVAYIECPRKNAKSTMSSGVGLYCTSADGETGAQVVSAATTRDQARIVFDDAKQMVKTTPGLRSKLGLKVYEHSIIRESDQSNFKALSRDQGGNLDGLNIHCAIIDELHAHKTRDIFDVIETATGARTQPLIWLITTAGFNRAGICYEQRDYVKKILGGKVDDDRYFGIVYTIDEGDDWTEPSSWVKANPNWGISVNPEDIEHKARKAMETPSAQNNFLTKHLNVWVNAETAWMDMRAWDACADPSINIEMFHGEQCITAYDLASKIDFAANVKLFSRDGKYYIFPTFYLPEDTIERADNSQYQGWERQGLITATDGPTIDFSHIEDDLLADCSTFQIEAVPYDPFQATEFSQRMIAQGVPMVEYRPTVLNFSESMKQLEALVLQKRLVHDGNPIMTWMISNVVCKRDHKDNIYPRKEFIENKIDGPVAAFMALGVRLQREIQGETYLETEGVPYVE